ncbi:CheR family methyltransferase [Paludibacterium denitrificans]|uniref:CheR family methyltransferase n=1 Tax=Paludibacterium denitrificans TaxID=2675226 RepID=UPI002477E866|nr:CheR family methyltransferase [Paludibacterium denitrificans]
MTGEGRELRFTLSDFRRIRELVQQQTGIALNDTKAHMAYARLGKRVRALGLRRFAEYLDRLVQQPDGDEWQHFINALTTNLTSFFREPHHFDLLREHAGRHRPPRTYRVWSAATASGEEAYSIAMTLQEVLGGEAGQRFEVWASDIDTRVLQQATNAIYPLERTEKLLKPLPSNATLTKASASSEARCVSNQPCVSAWRFIISIWWRQTGPAWGHLT